MTSIDTAPGDERDGPLRFRPGARRRNRIALGVVLGALAVGGNVLAYTSRDQSEPVLQAVVDIPAGSEIEPGQLRVVDVELSADVNAVAGDQLDALVGSYAKVRIVSGSLLVQQAVQAEPLVAPGSAVVAIVVPPGELPVGLRERVPVQLVLPGRDGEPVQTVEAQTVALPTDIESALGERSLSVEVAVADAPIVAAAATVRVVLLEPIVEPSGLAGEGAD